jgi:hypothetical protein
MTLHETDEYRDTRIGHYDIQTRQYGGRAYPDSPYFGPLDITAAALATAMLLGPLAAAFAGLGG